MSRRAAGLVLALALVVLVAGLLWWWLAGRGGRSRGVAPGEAAAGGPQRGVVVALYFPATGGLLGPEPRDLKVADDPKDRIRKVVQAVLAGPQRRDLVRPFPEQVTLGGVQLARDGTAFVDLRWADHEDPPASGSTEEMQRVYSVVDSVALNVPQVRRVVLLWNGVQRVTFAGHLDTSLPLAPDRGILSR
jgi:spore germination protein GerM